MRRELPLWADLLLALWIVVVGVVFFGPTVIPSLGLWTDTASVAYLLVLILAVITVALKLVHRHSPSSPAPPTLAQKQGNPSKRRKR